MTTRNVSRIAILGSGRGGPTLACELTKRGFEVRLFELPSFAHTIQPFQARGGIEISGEIFGFYTPELMTTDIANAVQGAEVIMLTTAASGHQAHFEAVAPHLEDGQIIVVNTSYYASLRFRDLIASTGKRVYLAETHSLPYLTERVSPTRVELYATKGELWVAALPATDTPHVVEAISQIFPEVPKIMAAPNVLFTALRINNPVLHPAVALANIGLIEHTKGDFEFYGYGMTPSVAKLAEGVDGERIAMGKRFGLTLRDYGQYQPAVYGEYGAKGTTLYEALHATTKQASWKFPIPSLAEFHLLREDLPYGLVPMSSLAQQIEVPTPTVNAVIHLLSLATGIDYRKEGITMERMGLAGKTVKEILQLVSGEQ